ncbi:MAG: calcium/sodium antiporter [Candidatus Gracilibacteria bacterium]|nr:calcium/sodium antiporter [Candidatus Gracilibacteria bacterium]MDD5178816.1 calcium/sodium antiporter [Candidatus Gracilibacteria bacterium]
MFLTYFLFALGFVLLVKGAEWLIEGAAVFARKFHISEIVVGLTLVAFGTSAPELVVNIISSLRGSGELVMGNIVGSNIANIALVLGCAALIAPLAIQKDLMKKEIPLGIFGVLLIWLLAKPTGELLTINRLGGLILITGFGVFLYLIFRYSKSKFQFPNIITKEMTLRTSLIFIVGGLIALSFGGEFVVDSARRIAESFGVSEKLIGLTLVAIGTSLPELVTSVVAVWKKKVDIAIGNVVGSNVFNIFWVLGISAVIQPTTFNQTINFDLVVLVGFTLLLLTATFLGKRYQLNRWGAALLLISYAGYLGYIVNRG